MNYSTHGLTLIRLGFLCGYAISGGGGGGGGGGGQILPPPLDIHYTVEPHYNEVLGTMEITLLYQVSHYIRVKIKEIQRAGASKMILL